MAFMQICGKFKQEKVNNNFSYIISMNRILFPLIFYSFALSETILIPEDYATIQEGIDASVDGDTVLVADGVVDILDIVQIVNYILNR